MQHFPHTYRVQGDAQASGESVSLSADQLPDLETAPPAEFGGPGDKWSPESLLVAAIADCFILSFKAIARGSRFEWQNIHCDVSGILDQVEKVTCFTHIDIKAVLYIEDQGKQAMGERLLHKAEQSCLITNSLTATVDLKVDVRTT